MDLRAPIGLLFTAVGILVCGFGVAHKTHEYLRTGINIDLAWGTVLIAFGVLMLGLAYGTKKSRGSAQ